MTTVLYASSLGLFILVDKYVVDSFNGNRRGGVVASRGRVGAICGVDPLSKSRIHNKSSRP